MSKVRRILRTFDYLLAADSPFAVVRGSRGDKERGCRGAGEIRSAGAREQGR